VLLRGPSARFLLIGPPMDVGPLSTSTAMGDWNSSACNLTAASDRQNREQR
jgi:hypothetical protein